MRRLVVLFACAQALVIQLEAGERECFMLEVNEASAVAGNFELIKPNKEAKPLMVTVTTDDEEKPLYESYGEPDGTFAFDVKDAGTLDLCIANGNKGKRDDRSRTVGFAIRVTSEHTTIEEGSLTELLEVSEQLTEGLLTLTDHQAYMRQREELHRKTLSTTKRRIFWWTCVEVLALILLAIWQVLYIKAFFETKRAV